MQPFFVWEYTITYEKARELLEVQVFIGLGYNRNSARIILAEVQREHGQTVVEWLIKELKMDEVF